MSSIRSHKEREQVQMMGGKMQTGPQRKWGQGTLGKAAGQPVYGPAAGSQSSSLGKWLCYKTLG